MANQRPSDELRSFRDRIIRLEAEKAEIADSIKDVYAEAGTRGYAVKSLRLVVKRQMEDPADRRAREATEEIAELYMATLGMLGGTPLGEAARARLNADPKAEPEDNSEQTTLAPETIGAEQIAEAHRRGVDDARAGKRILENPFIAGDPRRASWDEGFCEASGSDGMEIPDAWRRPGKKKPDEDGEK